MALPWEGERARPWEAVFLYPRTIEIRRPISNAEIAGVPQVGLVGYSGLEQNIGVSGVTTDGVGLFNSTFPGQVGETIIATGISASIQATNSPTLATSLTPSNMPGPVNYHIFLPATALARGIVKDRDIIVDDEGYRYGVSSNYWNSMGYRISAIRLEA